MIGFEPYDSTISLNCEYHEEYALHIRNWGEFANCNNLAAEESDDDTLEYGTDGTQHEHEHGQSEIQEYMSTTYIQI